MSAGRQERKVVTVLFCDLVGSTSQAEAMDPEDVAALLTPYHARVKEELERYGGTVEKFIGDAVMGLFGAPVAHEDDPERAIRAALAIRAFAEQVGLELRIGITTGEALVALDARPDSGETMATGDVVNTGDRLQSAAPVNGILVSERTFQATRHAIELREAKPITAKGKAQPVPVWEVVAARTPMVEERRHGTPLVGRTRELELLVGALERAFAEQQPQLVTLVGVPGIGKSRLVSELEKRTDKPVAWRRGRCLPYGDGVTFSALAEIVKAELAILDTDPPDRVEARLTDKVADGWVRSYLRPLVGLGVEGAGPSDRREEAYTAWRAFIEAAAAQRPLVLVFEDVHWADDALVDFVDNLVDWASGVPLLIVCTGRPELLDRHPAWGGGKTNASTLSLTPLTDAETSNLVGGLVDDSVVSADVREALVDRAGGNPLYAEQYALLVADGDDALELPETLQGVIAARLDMLAREHKALLHDASVVGESFWLGALRAISGVAAREAEASLHALERKGFVRRERETSIVNEFEYAFQHVLVREIAYGQIPRASRSDKHRLIAEWIADVAAPDESADLRAHHYGEALALAHAANLDTTALVKPACGAFRDAGDTAIALHAYRAAARLYEQALALWPEDDPERALLLLRRAKATFLGIDQTRVDLLDEARDALIASDELEGAAEAETLGAVALNANGAALDALARAQGAAALLEARPMSAAKAHVLANLARYLLVIADRSDDAIAVARTALAMSEKLDLSEMQAHAQNTIGLARITSGDIGGVDDLEKSLELALEHGSPFETGRIYNNLWIGYIEAGRLREASAATAAHLEMFARYGLSTNLVESRMATNDFMAGRWTDATRRIDALLASSGGVPNNEDDLRGLRATILLARGDTSGAAADCERVLELVRGRQLDAEGLATLHDALCGRAEVALAEDQREYADELVDEMLSLSARLYPFCLIDHILLLTDLDRPVDAILEEARSRPAYPWWGVAAAIVGESSSEPSSVSRSSDRFGTKPASDSVSPSGSSEKVAEPRRRSISTWRLPSTVRSTRSGMSARAILLASIG